MELGGVLGNASDGHHTPFIPSHTIILLALLWCGKQNKDGFNI